MDSFISSKLIPNLITAGDAAIISCLNSLESSPVNPTVVFISDKRSFDCSRATTNWSVIIPPTAGKTPLNLPRSSKKAPKPLSTVRNSPSSPGAYSSWVSNIFSIHPIIFPSLPPAPRVEPPDPVRLPIMSSGPSSGHDNIPNIAALASASDDPGFNSL